MIVQDYKTKEVLMMAYMNEEAFDHTLKSGKMTYYSRSRQCACTGRAKKLAEQFQEITGQAKYLKAFTKMYEPLSPLWNG